LVEGWTVGSSGSLLPSSPEKGKPLHRIKPEHDAGALLSPPFRFSGKCEAGPGWISCCWSCCCCCCCCCWSCCPSSSASRLTECGVAPGGVAGEGTPVEVAGVPKDTGDDVAGCVIYFVALILQDSTCCLSEGRALLSIQDCAI